MFPGGCHQFFLPNQQCSLRNRKFAQYKKKNSWVFGKLPFSSLDQLFFLLSRIHDLERIQDSRIQKGFEKGFKQRIQGFKDSARIQEWFEKDSRRIQKGFRDSWFIFWPRFPPPFLWVVKSSDGRLWETHHSDIHQKYFVLWKYFDFVSSVWKSIITLETLWI